MFVLSLLKMKLVYRKSNLILIKLRLYHFHLKPFASYTLRGDFFVLDRQTLVARFSHAESVGNTNY